MAFNIFTLVLGATLCLFVNHKGGATTQLQERKEKTSSEDNNSEFWEPDSQLGSKRRIRLGHYEKDSIEGTLDEIQNEKVQYNRSHPTAPYKIYNEENHNNHDQSRNKQDVHRHINKAINDNNEKDSINKVKIRNKEQPIDPTNYKNNKDHHRRQPNDPIVNKKYKKHYYRQPIDPIIKVSDKDRHHRPPIEMINNGNERHHNRGHKKKPINNITDDKLTINHDKIKKDKYYRSHSVQLKNKNDKAHFNHDHPTELPPLHFKQFRLQRTKPLHASTNDEYGQKRTQYSSKPEYYFDRLKNDRTEIKTGSNKKGNNFRENNIGRTGWEYNTIKSSKSSTRLTPMYLMQEKEEQEEREEEREPEKYVNEDNVEHHHEHNKGKHSKSRDECFILNAYSIADQFDQLLSEFPDVEVNSTIVGRTASYINIYLLKISQRTSYFRTDHVKYDDNNTAEKKIVFIVHALSPMGLTKLYSLTKQNYLKTLLSFYLKHLDKFDIYLMPLGNPDGYMMVKNKVDYWNKNTSPQNECPGVDVDRNFDVAWNSSEEMSSCSQHYPGATPFSEPESRAVRDVFHQNSHKLVAYFHVHAGTYDLNTFKGDAVLYPRGYSDSTTDDDKYMDLRGEIDEAMKNANFKTLSVTVDTLHNWYGRVIGTSVDYASTVYGIPYAMELVMQVYQDPLKNVKDMLLTGHELELELYSLNEIWGRVIDVLFMNIHRKLQENENDQTLR